MMPQRVRPGAQLAPLALVLLLAAPLAAAKADGWSTAVPHLPAGTPFDVAGGQLVWLAPTGDHVDVLLQTLQDAQVHLLTTVGPIAGHLDVRSLTFDGRYAAWCDNRFGNLEVFALDTADGTLQRLTQSGSDDLDPVVDQGRVAWTRDGQVWIEDLANRTAWPVSGATGAAEPALAGPLVAWIHAAGFERSVHWSGLSGEHPGSWAVNGTFAHALRGEQGLLAWEAWALRDPAAPVKGFNSTAVMVLQDGGPSSQAALYRAPAEGASLGVAVGGGHVAWADPETGQVHTWTDGKATPADQQGIGLMVSDQYLVVEQQLPDGDARLVARPWATAGLRGHGLAGLPVGPLMAALVVALGVARRGRKSPPSLLQV